MCTQFESKGKYIKKYAFKNVLVCVCVCACLEVPLSVGQGNECFPVGVFGEVKVART